MEELTSRKAYPSAMAAQIEAMGAMAVSVANRWVMGWPQRVKALVKSGAYLGCLETRAIHLAPQRWIPDFLTEQQRADRSPA